MTNERDDAWRESTEGDLDPDLTEEAGYGAWEPRRSIPWSLLYRLGLVVALVGVLGSAVMVFLR